MYASLAELDAALADMIQWSRPASQSARYTALNYGYRECAHAVAQVRPEHFLQETLLVLPANVYRVPIAPPTFLYPVQKVKSIQVFTGTAEFLKGQAVAAPSSPRFQYASVESDRFQLAQAGGYATDTVFYDVLFGVVSPELWLGTAPTLALAPALIADVQVVLQTIFYPPELGDPHARVWPVIQPHGESVLAFAMSWLLQTVNDIEAGRWREQGAAGLMTLREAAAQVSQQQTEFLDSGLWFSDE